MPESLRILVVESEESLCGQLVGPLRAAGHVVDVARSGREALLRVGQSRYERVILNPRLPDVAGILLYLMLRGIDPDLRQHTLFVSGSAPAPGAREELSRLGLGFLPRPFTLEDLLERLAAG